jgi:peroxiredoxin
VTPLFAQVHTDGPANQKAQKTYAEALEYLRRHNAGAALDDFKKADQQDGGHCLTCQKQMIKLGIEEGDWKAAELASQEMIGEAKGPQETATVHYQFALVLFNEGARKHKEECFARGHEEIARALFATPNFPEAVFLDGKLLAHLSQDAAARARFEEFVKLKPADDPSRQRALRFASRPELARARMAPAFSITTSEGQRLSLDDLQGKVVLVDFWATWCAPCRDALARIRSMAKTFQGQPLVILSVSLDGNEQKWREFVEKNEMAWPQYRDGGFSGPLSRMFDVRVIPHTFTIDADGVLQDENVGDVAIEGRLKKLLKGAREWQSTETLRK